jgi:hypothetical protein
MVYANRVKVQAIFYLLYSDIHLGLIWLCLCFILLAFMSTQDNFYTLVCRRGKSCDTEEYHVKKIFV